MENITNPQILSGEILTTSGSQKIINGKQTTDKSKFRFISTIISAIFIIVTLIFFGGLIPTLLTLPKTNPISIPLLSFLALWGTLCTFMAFVTINLIKKKRLGFYLGIGIYLIALVYSLSEGSWVVALFCLLVISGLIAARSNYS
jgi:predicted membrane channel-forming protein YqfA (hemolysin III family)